eukprot:scaffold3.g6625.t1
MLDDAIPTTTSIDQRELERRVSVLYEEFEHGAIDENDEELVLKREAHTRYLQGGLGALPPGFIVLDASRTWICYWILHALALLDAPLPASPSREAIIAFLASCQHPDGGFGGGPYQLPHLAPTYAAVSALVTLGGPDALGVIDRPALHAYLLRMCVPPARGGGMTMNEGGEVDVRGCYIAMAVCHMLCLDKQAAHGGYAFCGLAAAALLGGAAAAATLDLPALLRWAAQRQGAIEGGFMGRTNKLVDGCYSLWQGGAFPVLHELMEAHGGGLLSSIAAGVAPPPAAPTAAAPAAAPEPAPAAALGSRHDSAASIPSDQQGQGDAGGASGGQEGGAASVTQVADCLADLLLSGGTDWVASLQTLPPLGVAERQTLPPLGVAERQVERLQQQLDSVVEASLQAEDALRAAVQLQRAEEEVAALRQEAAGLAIEHAKEHLEVMRTSAAVLTTAGAGGSAQAAAAPGAAQQQLLYNATALQLWLLKCCQGGRGGMRDKPGKAPDYYHTCYCLSGLSSSQHYSGVVLGGPANKLRRADPLCNVVADRVAEAVAFFAEQPL